MEFSRRRTDATCRNRVLERELKASAGPRTDSVRTISLKFIEKTPFGQA
jgi:hypothetical protein